VRVDQRQDDGMVLEVVRAEQDPGHLNRVTGPLGGRHGAHERLVAEPHVAVDHVEVALVDRHVDGLADRPAAVVEERAQVGELHEVAEVLDRAVAPAVVEVADERRAVVRGQDGVAAADLDVVVMVPGVLGELARRRRLDDLAAHPAREPDPFALDVGAGVAEEMQGVAVAAELEADLLEDRVGVLLDDREALVVQDLERSQRPGQERFASDMGPGPGGLPAGASAGSLAGRFLDGHRSSFAADTTARRRRPPPSGRPPPPPGPASRCGRSVTVARWVDGAVRWGKAIASTKCSWKRGSTAVSIFSTRRTTSSISRRAAALSSAINAPVPAALPAALTWSSGASGIRPRTIAWKGSIWLPKAPARRTSST